MKMARVLIQIIFLGIFLVIIKNGNMVLWLGIFLLSLLGAAMFGRFYCGYLCPMNTVMGFTGKIAKKLKWQTDKVPKFLSSRILPWIVLAMMAASVILSKRVLHRELPILIILIVLSVLVTLRYEEWVFHNHVCPYGALLRLTGQHAKFATKVDHSLCIGCKKCEAVCPSRSIEVDVDIKKASVNSSICHQCQSCTEVCPVEAIQYRTYAL
ncbi:MAG: 4Fe-4S binding protein [Dethiosulfatibacter sp.]|nr:4Fe-4S binding protein [Dethiosulfatibacter sp.]